MPLEGLRWSRDSGSALYDTPQTAVLGRAGGGVCIFGVLTVNLLTLPGWWGGEREREMRVIDNAKTKASYGLNKA